MGSVCCSSCDRAIREHLESIENVKKKQKEHIKVQQQQRPETDFKRGVVKDSETACQTDCIKIETEIEVLKIKRRAKVHHVQLYNSTVAP